eukprot:TRINITY_DN2958_c0_g2_i1.p1 TRINITY_DN2958_c0_g2~~TRINITY_DN2958_c0_g2_i1.p1  ORF type:complete len:447 (-),score=74.45 TRINITY_DN2958_c0_g2_i1:79-1419(-)
MLDGTDGNSIWINTSVWWDERDGGSVVIDTEAKPTTKEESRVCSCSMMLTLPAGHFGDGTVLVRSALRLPSTSTPPRADYNLFGSSLPENRLNDTTDGFAVISKDGRLALDVRVERERTTSNVLVFTDVRQWGPNFSVRLGDCASAFDWKPNQVRSWRLRIKSCTNPSSNSVIPKSLTLQEGVYNLTPEQLKRFREDGYLVLSNLIPREMVSRALRNINKSIGKGIPADQLVSFNAGSWCHELRNHSSLTSLFRNTTVRAVVDSFLGAENVPEHTGGHVQIALRFPTDPPATKAEHLHHHIDGIPTDTNGLAKGQLYPFTMLVGVYLNEVQDDDAGNLVVYPGTHLKHAEYFRQVERGPESLLDHNPFVMPKIEMPKPVQLKVKAGDVLFAHYLLAHSIASNVSPNIRYALYSRVTSELQHQHNAQEKYKSMKHPWIDWPVYQDQQ